MVQVLTPIVDDVTAIQLVPITLYQMNVSNYAFTVVYSIYVPNLQPEDIVLVKAQFELMGTYPVAIPTGRYIYRTLTPTDAGPALANPCKSITEPVMTDYMQGSASQVETLIGVDTGMPAGNYYYNVVVYCASGSYCGNMQVAQRNGDCTAMVFDRP